LFLSFLRQGATGINRVGIVVAELGLAILMILTVYASLARYVFQSPSVHATEISVYLLLLLTWASVGWVHLEGRHVCMEALDAHMGRGWKRVARVVSHLTVLVFCLVLVWAGVLSAWRNFSQDYKSTSLLEFPLWIPYALIPLGGVLLAVMAFSRLLNDPEPEEQKGE